MVLLSRYQFLGIFDAMVVGRLGTWNAQTNNERQGRSWPSQDGTRLTFFNVKRHIKSISNRTHNVMPGSKIDFRTATNFLE